ncbi:MAG: hypothetical protein Q7J14_01275, partial [Candidatus Magasanikbacteria bacterium]|nr:hypothetical protein [Candidatus Magasanikbacteria bacterium]
MYTYIFLVIILICLFVMGFIAVPKIYRLANLDVNNLPEEVEQQKKKEIIFKRLEIKGKEFGKKIGKRLSFLQKFWSFIQGRFRVLVFRIEKLWHHEENMRKKIV